jgi:hypothetical protein
MMGSRYFSLYAPAKLRIELPSQAPDLGNLASKVPSPLQLIRSWQSLPPTHPHRSFRPKQVDAFSSISLLSTLNPFTGEGRNCRPAQRRNLSSIYRAAPASGLVHQVRKWGINLQLIWSWQSFRQNTETCHFDRSGPTLFLPSRSEARPAQRRNLSSISRAAPRLFLPNTVSTMLRAGGEMISRG